jgi:predicted RNase H-like nuclease (RuvC/YqgF family)
MERHSMNMYEAALRKEKNIYDSREVATDKRVLAAEAKVTASEIALETHKRELEALQATIKSLEKKNEELSSALDEQDSIILKFPDAWSDMCVRSARAIEMEVAYHSEPVRFMGMPYYVLGNETVTRSELLRLYERECSTHQDMTPDGDMLHALHALEEKGLEPEEEDRSL